MYSFWDQLWLWIHSCTSANFWSIQPCFLFFYLFLYGNSLNSLTIYWLIYSYPLLSVSYMILWNVSTPKYLSNCCVFCKYLSLSPALQFLLIQRYFLFFLAHCMDIITLLLVKWTISFLKKNNTCNAAAVFMAGLVPEA